MSHLSAPTLPPLPPTLLPSLQLDLLILSRLHKRNQSQHRSALFFQRINQVLRLGKRVYGLVGELGSEQERERERERKGEGGNKGKGKGKDVASRLLEMVKLFLPVLVKATEQTNLIIQHLHFLPFVTILLGVYSRLWVLSCDLLANLAPSSPSPTTSTSTTTQSETSGGQQSTNPRHLKKQLTADQVILAGARDTFTARRLQQVMNEMEYRNKVMERVEQGKETSKGKGKRKQEKMDLDSGNGQVEEVGVRIERKMDVDLLDDEDRKPNVGSSRLNTSSVAKPSTALSDPFASSSVASPMPISSSTSPNPLIPNPIDIPMHLPEAFTTTTTTTPMLTTTTISPNSILNSVPYESKASKPTKTKKMTKMDLDDLFADFKEDQPKPKKKRKLDESRSELKPGLKVGESKRGESKVGRDEDLGFEEGMKSSSGIARDKSNSNSDSRISGIIQDDPMDQTNLSEDNSVIPLSPSQLIPQKKVTSTRSKSTMQTKAEPSDKLKLKTKTPKLQTKTGKVKKKSIGTEMDDIFGL